MRRRALRPSFVVTFVLGAAAIAGGCNSGSVTNNPPPPSPDGGGDSSMGHGACPALEPVEGTSCALPSSASCDYGPCADAPDQTATCQQGTWSLLFPSGCNPPSPIEAGPDATGDVAPDAGSD